MHSRHVEMANRSGSFVPARQAGVAEPVMSKANLPKERYAPPVHIAPSSQVPMLKAASPAVALSAQQISPASANVISSPQVVNFQAPPKVTTASNYVQPSWQPEQPLNQVQYPRQIGLTDRIKDFLTRPPAANSSLTSVQSGRAETPRTSTRIAMASPTANSRSDRTSARPPQRSTNASMAPSNVLQGRPHYQGQPGTKRNLFWGTRNRQTSRQPSRQGGRSTNRRQPVSVGNHRPASMAHAQRRPVRQVQMVEPIQDPFNDHPATIRQEAVAPTMRPSRSTKYQDSSMKQISVLADSSDDRSPDTNDLQQPESISIPENRQLDFSPVEQRQTFEPQETTEALPRPDLQQPDRDPLVPQSGNNQDEILPPPDQFDELPKGDFGILEIEQDPNRERIDNEMNELEQDADRRLEEIRGLSDADDLDFDPRGKTCDKFRDELLGGSIRDIELDISPPVSRYRRKETSISRSWTDLNGNVIAHGAIQDLQKGYVIIDGEQGRQKIPYAKLSDADWHAISDYWHLPELCIIRGQEPPSREWIPQSYAWKASNLCHKPLFFENVQLERYGHSHGPFRQPLYSTAHFFVSLVTVPYQSGIHPATECEYALGYYRPGNCAPWLRNPIPLSLNGAARQALITTGIAVIP